MTEELNSSPQDSNSEQVSHRKGIRSYVLRQGRMTKAQELAFESAWPKFGIDYQNQTLDMKETFDAPEQPLVLEIGFGNGKSLADMAEENPELNYLGVEVHGPGVGSLLMEIESRSLSNLRCMRHDAIEVLQNMLPEQSLETVQLFFPDPWPKKKHHKRRIVKKEFLGLVTSRLKSGGRFHMATDWWPYAEDAMEVLSAYEGLSNTMGEGQFSERPVHRPKTKFETRGENLGHGVWDLIFQKP